MKMIDMSRKENSSSPCCDVYDPKYPIGFFLSPDQIKSLGLMDIEPEQKIQIQATLMVSSVTERKDECECYVRITEMGIMSSGKKDPKDLMSSTYEGGEDGE